MLKSLVLAATLLATTALAPTEARADWTYQCNHCHATLAYQGKGYAETCPSCNELNVLTTCQDCGETWVLSRYGDWTCSSCRRQQAVSQCPGCHRQSVGNAYAGWTRCPYEDCGGWYYALHCDGCRQPLTAWGTGWITCPDCGHASWRQ